MFRAVLIPVESVMPRLRAVIPNTDIGVLLIVGVLDSIQLVHPQHLDVDITSQCRRHFVPVSEPFSLMLFLADFRCFDCSMGFVKERAIELEERGFNEVEGGV
jgi:hypothetical protein